jgi:hypothetical protein
MMFLVKWRGLAAWGHSMAMDEFLEIIPVRNERDAMKDSISSAARVRGGKKIYEDGVRKPEFRAEWRSLIRKESIRYVQNSQTVLDDAHCKAIANISGTLSAKFGTILVEGKLRYGVSQKAFNLYLKYLWRVRIADGKPSVPPPHCPVDGVVLRKGTLPGVWTLAIAKRSIVTG